MMAMGQDKVGHMAQTMPTVAEVDTQELEGKPAQEYTQQGPRISIGFRQLALGGTGPEHQGNPGRQFWYLNL
jgi:hypothetical protein